MTKRLIATGLLAVLLALAAPSAVPAAPPRSGPSPVVVLVLAPYLRWDDVLSGNMPETRALAEAGAAGNVNVRSLLPDAGPPSVDAGALMLSAGTWARYDSSAPAPTQARGTYAVVFPGLEAQRRANAHEDADIRLGTLGEAVVKAGGWTAAIGSGDTTRASRPAALVAMDAGGRVRYGDVTSATVVAGRADEAPLGRVSNTPWILSDVSRVLREGRGPGLIVVDPGDLARAHEAGAAQGGGLERTDRLAALAALDALVGALPNELPKDAVLVVAAPVAGAADGEPPGFAPLLISGKGWTGVLTSSSTHRSGLVTNADITATILSSLGVPRPPQVAGSVIVSTAAAADAGERLSALARADAFMRAVDTARPAVVTSFILASVLLVALCAALAVLPAPRAFLVHGAQIALLGLLSVPVASLLMYAVVYMPQTPRLVAALLVATAAVVWTADTATHHAGTGPRALAVLALLTALVVVLDQWLGAWLSLDGLLSYSPLVGARYYGMGNEAAALMVGGALTGCALLFDAYASFAWTLKARTWGFPAFAVLCVATAAAPMLGANIGVAVWGTLAFTLGWRGMLGRRVGWREILVALLAALLLVGAFVGLDLVAGRGTHLGRSVRLIGRGGWSALSTLVARKAATSLRLTLGSAWTALFVALVGALAYVRLRPKGTLRDLMIEHPSFSAALAASLAGAVASFLTEDSGVIVPALLLLFPGIAVVYLMLGAAAGKREGRVWQDS